MMTHRESVDVSEACKIPEDVEQENWWCRFEKVHD